MMTNYREDYFLLEAEGALLPAVLTQPEDGAVGWGIVLIPGSMASDVDGNYPSANMKPHLYADLARQLAQRGHAVLRYAKLGSDTGAQVVDEAAAAAHPMFAQQQYIATAAFAKLRELVPGAKGFALAGHSEGAVHGLVLAQRPELGADAYISLSGPAPRYMDLFIHMARTLEAEQGEVIDFGAFKVTAKNYIRTFELMRAGEPLTDEIKADPTMAYFVQHWDSDSPEATQGKQYMRDYDAIDPIAEIAKLPCPVLIVQGGQDQSAVVADNGERLYKARHAARPDAVAYRFFPDLQHFYKVAQPGLNSFESMQLDGESDVQVSDAISAWLYALPSHA